MIKLKDILVESIGFQIPGTPKSKNIGRQTRQEFAKFFNTFEAGTTKTAISSYAEKIASSNADEATKRRASEVLTKLEEVAIDIQDELHTRQISDNAVAEKIFDYVNSEIDPNETTEFEQLLWYDTQIDMSIQAGMIDNAVSILEQLLDQLEFIRGFIVQELPEIPRVGFKYQNEAELEKEKFTTPDQMRMYEELAEIDEDLRRWAKEKWTDQHGNPCGSSKSKGVVKCRPSKKVSKKTPKTWSQVDKKKEVAKKRKVGMGKRTKKAEVAMPIKEKKKKAKRDACYHKVKGRYDVWPSARASQALVKCRKVGAKNWGKTTTKK